MSGRVIRCSSSVYRIVISITEKAAAAPPNAKKELIKIVDLLGRETEFKPNMPLIFIYSDGTMERLMEVKY